MATGSRIERKKYEKKNGRQSNRKQTPRPKGRKIIKTTLIVLIGLAFLTIIGGAGLFGYYAMGAPTVTMDDLRGQVSSKIYDNEGDLVLELGGQSRDLLEPDEIPQVLEDAVLAIEDSRFYSHLGVDPIRIVGSFLANLRAGEITQGGSTITQQLIKLSVFSTDFQDQTYERKAQEAWLALQLEQELSKEEILALYLNKIFYSNNTYGAKTAARNFFGKDIKDITLSEAALLAGIPQAPSDYDPYSNPEAAKERRDLVLAVMLDDGLISQQEHDEAVNQSIESMLVPLDNNEGEAPEFILNGYIDVVAQEVQDKMNINIYTDGVEVYTNLDADAQRHIYDLVNNNTEIGFTDDNMQTAVSVVDVDTGALVAVIGGRKLEVALGLNRANSLNRSVGSTMKPLSAYGPAIEYLNYSTGTLVVDEAYTYSDGTPINNYDFNYLGNQTMREALAGSRNIPALKMLQDVGLDNAYAFLQKMNINILNNNQRELVESNAIGGEVTPIQLAAAYATIANYGEYNEPTAVIRVVTSSGTVEEFTGQSRQAMKETTAYMLVDMLKDVPGTFASAAQIEGLNHAGKTGTTNYTDEQLAQLGLNSTDYAAPDGWYAGITPQYAMVAWVGYDNPTSPGNYLTLEETRIPQSIYRETMTFLMKDVPNTDWVMPSNIKRVEIEKYTDPISLPGPYTPTEMRSEEIFILGTEPTTQSLTYGRYLNGPTAFDASYIEDSQSIYVSWSGALDGNAQYELSLNGTVIYTGTGTSFTISAAADGEYVFRLRIVEGNSSSDTSVITVTLTTEAPPESEESSEESLSESASDPPAESEVPTESLPEESISDPAG
ncbi:transglycosylase domain-containing protein [Fundicoccus culcitae]|uniref:PBP1A family penicillin-binding protein n=1 Tax=Fundicoccus culcitae TaxID=2969821 RepID=A0ABY5P823_9LACT|nr:PBP1A family penicillin-binding protein [Fundicoccus culcitae]UUX34530.1 PBP1A family penicillin-binding protein [Fundicoccus culcitae]